MNMISITGEVKHDLIGWDSLEEIYTKEEVIRRVNSLCPLPQKFWKKPFNKLEGNMFNNIRINPIRDLNTGNELMVFYYGQYVYSCN